MLLLLFCAVIIQWDNHLKSHRAHVDDYLTKWVKVDSRQQSKWLNCFCGSEHFKGMFNQYEVVDSSDMCS